MVPNGHDTIICAKVTFNSATEDLVVNFDLYGEACANNVCNGPEMMMIGCEHAANHGQTNAWA